MKKKIIFVAITVVTTILVSCSGGNMDENKITYTDLNNVPVEKFSQLKRKTIYFGHQSLGFNIVDGINSIMAKNEKIDFNIVEKKNADAYQQGVFAHSTIGVNKNPKSKIDDFFEKINDSNGNKIDIAFFKFCYVDIDASSDIDGIFKEYLDGMNVLQKNHPEIKFVHLTVPLTIIQKGIKGKIKKIIGRPLGGYADNQKRNEFNKKIKSEFPKVQVFDLALFEATYPDGKLNTYEMNGNMYLALINEYTDDGNHLNRIGQEYVAEQLLIFLANL